MSGTQYTPSYGSWWEQPDWWSCDTVYWWGRQGTGAGWPFWLLGAHRSPSAWDEEIVYMGTHQWICGKYKNNISDLLNKKTCDTWLKHACYLCISVSLRETVTILRFVNWYVLNVRAWIDIIIHFRGKNTFIPHLFSWWCHWLSNHPLFLTE